MRYFTCSLAPVLVAVGAWVALTPTAEAAPECTNITSVTTICQTNGSAQIVTSPQVRNNYGMWPWWGGGGITIGFGGWGW